jgi:hypothetical protein
MFIKFNKMSQQNRGWCECFKITSIVFNVLVLIALIVLIALHAVRLEVGGCEKSDNQSKPQQEKLARMLLLN